ncbi:hypothetical protein VTH06DRAFT_50 [Thermothelomyces fergusii]
MSEDQGGWVVLSNKKERKDLSSAGPAASSAAQDAKFSPSTPPTAGRVLSQALCWSPMAVEGGDGSYKAPDTRKQTRKAEQSPEMAPAELYVDDALAINPQLCPMNRVSACERTYSGAGRKTTNQRPIISIPDRPTIVHPAQTNPASTPTLALEFPSLATKSRS